MADDKSHGRILEIGEELSLSGLHLNHYFRERNWPAECVALKGRSLRDLKAWLPFEEEAALVLRLPLEESAQVLEIFPHLPTAVNSLQTTDSLVRENGEWWPRLSLPETLRSQIVNQFGDLDISLNSYVIGASRRGRAAAVALVSLGYSRVSLVDEDETKLAREVALLRRYLFGVQIEAVPAQTLTVRESPGSLMLNTVQLQAESAILGDLSYFNFMKTGGVVVDISECSPFNHLLEEAGRANLKVLSGLRVQSWSDVEMLRRLFPDRYITYEDYLESFSDNLPSLKNSSSV